MDLKGNQLHFLSSRIQKEYGMIMRKFIKAASDEGEVPPPAMALIKKMYFNETEETMTSQLGVLRVTPEGLVVVSQATGDGMEAALIAAGVVPVGVMAALLLPAIQKARAKAREVQSLNQLRQLSIALHVYHEDKGALPAADKWSDELLPYVGNTVEVFVSPLETRPLRSSYAFNKHLSGKSMDDLKSPARTVVFFESRLDWNGAGDVNDIVAHGDGFLVGFADGHVERLHDGLDELIWKP